MAFNEDTSFIEYNVEQPTQDFVTNFSTIGGTTDVVLVTVDGVITDTPESSYTVQQINHTTWRVTPEVQAGSVVRLYRVTNIDEMMHVFTAGAKFIARNMDNNFKQIRHSQQEVRDGFSKLSEDTYAIIDTLQVVGEVAQDAADAAEQAAQTANAAAAQVNDKVSYQDLDNAVDVAIGNGVDASFVVDASGKTQQEINSASPKYQREATFPIQFANEQYFYGEGRRSLTLRVPPSSSGVTFHPTSTARNSLKGVHLFSEGMTRTAGTVGVNTSDSSFAIVDDVRVTGFDIGIIDNNTPDTSSFTARNSYREFEANSCNTGVKAYGSNANNYSFGRLWGCDVGFDFNDAEAINLIGLNIESCATGIKTNKSAFINLFGGYLESGVGNKNFELDKETSISAYGVKVNGVRGFDECYDPNTSEWHFDAKDTNSTKSRLSFIPAASNQYLKNTDFSMGLFGWTASGLTATIQSTDFESSSQAVLLTPTAGTQYLQQSFNIERDASKISIAVRYKPKSAGTFRVNVLQGSTIVGQYTYTSSAASDDFLTATVTPAITDTTQLITVRIYPDVVGGVGTAVVDQVWAVRGYFVSAPRRYQNSTVLLDTPTSLVSKTVTTNTTDVVTLANIPTGARGLRVRIVVTATLAETNLTYVHINGKDVQVTAMKNDQKAVGEFTIVGTSPLDIRALTGSASNSVTYKVELVEWII